MVAKKLLKMGIIHLHGQSLLVRKQEGLHLNSNTAGNGMQPERQRDIINDVLQPAAVSHIDLFYLYRRNGKKHQTSTPP